MLGIADPVILKFDSVFGVLGYLYFYDFLF